MIPSSCEINAVNLTDSNTGQTNANGPFNMDMRIAKTFDFSERVRLHSYFEFFNLVNRDNPAAVQSLSSLRQPFGSALQVLPGRADW